MQTIQMLRQLTQVDGVAGGEDRALAVAQEICENLGECSRTIQKSLVCQVMPPQEGRPHLLLDAHIDEIGLTVTHIEDNGFLRVGPGRRRGPQTADGIAGGGTHCTGRSARRGGQRTATHPERRKEESDSG